MTHPNRSTALAVALTLAMSCLASGGQQFRDEFDDGDLLDDQPVSWQFDQLAGDGGAMGITDEALEIRFDGGVASATSQLGGNDRIYGDASIRTQITIVDRETFLAGGIFGRSSPAGVYGISISQAGRVSFFGPNFEMVDDVSFNPANKNAVNLRLDMIGPEISASVWEASEPEPAIPMWQVTDHDLSNGAIGVFANSGPGVNRWVQFAHFEVVPEPSSLAMAFLSSLGALAVWRRRPR